MEEVKPCSYLSDNLMIEKSCQKIGSQWQISYPWKIDPASLHDNRIQAERNFESTEGRLAKYPDQAREYNKKMKEMV